MANFMLPQALPSVNSPISHLAVELLTQIWGHVPRSSLAQVLQVSQTWYTQATDITYLWDHLAFGPYCTTEDIAVAKLWIMRAQTLKLTATIAVTLQSPPESLLSIFDMLSGSSHQLGALFITAPEDAAEDILRFLSGNSFDALQTLSAIIEVDVHHSSYGRLPLGYTDTVHVLPLAHLTRMHCTNIPLILPASPSHIHTLVFGPHHIRKMLMWQKLGQMLESVPTLTRLGFHGTMASFPEPAALLQPVPINLPSLRNLSFRCVHPESVARFLNIVVAPFLTGLGLEMRPWHLAHSSPVELLCLLSDEEFTRRLTILNIFDIGLSIDHTFFQPFFSLKTLRLNFHNGLKREFWQAFSNATHMPCLRNLILVDVHPIHVQELVLSRQRASQSPLEFLELLYSSGDAVATASTPAWSTWLAANVLHFSRPQLVIFSDPFEEF